jgi:peptidoglycan/xylan/chitin deacetylase (PgdA/CDA1 family)
MSDWHDLDRELDAWRIAGRRATLWCRDDDATRDTPALATLLRIAKTHAVPVALAVIPAQMQADLIDAMHAASQVRVLQHGFAHRNHASPSEKRCELGAQRSLPAVLAELEAGREALARAFGRAYLPVLVPPWNRIHASVVAALPRAGFSGLSTFAPRAAPYPAPGVVQCNTHVDLVDWRGGRTFVGASHAIASTVEHLAARREGRVDAGEATGILTHHLDLGDDAWTFLEALFARTRDHAAVAWLAAERVFGEPRALLGQGDAVF